MEIQRNNNKSKTKHNWLGMNAVMPSLDKNKEGIAQEKCICHRSRGLITCNSCQKSFMGRIAERCPEHPEVIDCKILRCISIKLHSLSALSRLSILWMHVIAHSVELLQII